MQLEITDSPNESDEQFVIAQTRAYNRRFTVRDARSLGIFVRTEDGCIIGGLTGKTYWQYLEVSFLWVIRLGYEEFGRLSGFSGEHDRHYLHKVLDAPAGG